MDPLARTRPKTFKALFMPLLPMLILWHACSNALEGTDAEENPGRDRVVVQSEKMDFYIDTLYTALENPWSLAWLPDGRLLVTERTGKILVFKDDHYTGELLANVPAIFAQGQGGLFDIKLHPDYAENGWVYLIYAKPINGGAGTTLTRAKLEGNDLVNIEELFVSQPATNAALHFGGRIAFDDARYIYFSSGERGTKENAQNIGNDLGKVHRLHDDGRVPDDNPFVSIPNARPSIWSYGHRNPQGLVYDQASGILWETEHGPKGGDELNSIERGKNYGWPVITYGIDYDGSIISEQTEKEGMEQPVHYWTPSIATCGLELVSSARYPNWKGNLIVGALAQQHIARVELDGINYAGEEKLLERLGRIRQIGQSPEGLLYIVAEEPGALYKIVPAQNGND